jgi:Ca2+-binding EF-hand superfamily protein
MKEKRYSIIADDCASHTHGFDQTNSLKEAYKIFDAAKSGCIDSSALEDCKGGILGIYDTQKCDFIKVVNI